MIGRLPKTLTINGEEKLIRADMNTAFLIFDAINNDELNEVGKVKVMLECLYIDEIDYCNLESLNEAIKQAIWFLNGGKEYGSSSKKVIDWCQDEQMIFSAVNKVAGTEVRNKEDLHWWTFLGYFSEIGEGLFSTVINIRNKKNKGQKLERYEQEFYNSNKQLIDLKRKYTIDEQNIIDKLKNICE